MNPRELELSIVRLLDNRMKPDERENFIGHLLDDKEALEIYRQHALLDSAFHRMVDGHQALGDDEPIARIAAQRTKRRMLRNTLLGAAAIALATLTVLRFTLVDGSSTTLTFTSAPDSSFTVSHHGEIDPSSFPADALAIGSSLELTQGSLEITFKSGVRSIIEAPADFTLHDEQELYLNTGRGRFQVPEEAIGFTVRTPELRVIDLGTEFAVLSAPLAGDEVHVFEGSVQADTLNPAGQVVDTAVLGIGQSRLVTTAGKLGMIPNDPNAFADTLPDGLRSILFSFDEKDATRVEVDGELTGQPPLEAKLINPDQVPTRTTGVMGRALSMNGRGVGIETDWEGFRGQTPRSVTFWLRTQPQARQFPELPPVVGWGDPSSGIASRWKVCLAPVGDDSSDEVVRLSFGPERFDAETPVNDGEWHHVAVVYTGKTLSNGLADVAIYVDGVPENVTRNPGVLANLEHPSPVNTLTRTNNARPLRIGFGFENEQSFSGEIDELCIHQGAISASTIESLVDSAR